jgi:hypothetical protein
MASPAVPLPSCTAKEIRKDERRLPNGADWKRVSVSGLFFVIRLEPELGSRALRIASAATFRPRERHGGTFGKPGEGLLGCSPGHQRSKRQRVGVKDSPSVGRPNAFVGVIS